MPSEIILTDRNSRPILGLDDNDDSVDLALFERGNKLFVPTIGGDGGESGQTYVANKRNGRYFKFGPLVVFSIYAVLSAKGTITGSVQLKGLPFPVINIAELYWRMPVYWHALATNWSMLSCYLVPGTTIGNITGAAGAGSSTSATALTTADITNDTQLLISGSYLTSQ